MSLSNPNSMISGGYNGLVPVAWEILVMGLSLTGIILIYLWIGHIGPTFSSDVMNLQQSRLRHMYGLPNQPIVTDKQILPIVTDKQILPIVTDKQILQIPPSLRNVPNSVYDSPK